MTRLGVTHGFVVPTLTLRKRFLHIVRAALKKPLITVTVDPEWAGREAHRVAVKKKVSQRSYAAQADRRALEKANRALHPIPKARRKPKMHVNEDDE
jgi:hypothetical protein